MNFKTVYEEMKFFAKNKFNVLLEGHAGIGKSALVKKLFKELYGDDWVYLSCSTLDPYLEIKGIPRPEKDQNDRETGHLTFLTPGWHSRVRAIFLDEVGREDKVVRNALMEMIQFRSINGKRLEHLEVVWGAKNPVDDAGTYSVEMLDPAQLTRYDAVISLPYDVDDDYFAEQFGRDAATAICSWWREIPETLRSDINPRRLESALRIHQLGGNIRYSIPEKAGVDKLLQYLNSGPSYYKLQSLIKQDKKNEVAKFLAVENNYASCIHHILQDKNMLNLCLPVMKSEKIADLVSTKEEAYEVFRDNLETDFEQLFTDIYSSKINKKFNDKIVSMANTDKVLGKALESFGLECFNSDLFISSKTPAKLPASFKMNGSTDYKALETRTELWEKEIISYDEPKRAAVYKEILAHIPPKKQWNYEIVRAFGHALSTVFGNLCQKWDKEEEEKYPELPGLYNEYVSFMKKSGNWDKVKSDPDNHSPAFWTIIMMPSMAPFMKKISFTG